MMMLHIYLFRHGQTYYNKRKIFTGWKDSVLTPQGVRDARKIAQKLKNKKFEVAVCSDLARSKQTLRQVLKYHKHIKVIVDKRIRERNYGLLNGHSHAATIRKYGREKFELWHRSYAIAPPKGESIRMVEKRVDAFIKNLIKMMKKKKVNVAISAHGNSMRPFRRHFEHLSIKQMMKLENPWDGYFEYEIKI